MVRGDDFSFAFTVFDVSSTGVRTTRNLTGGTGKAQIRSGPNQTGALIADMAFGSSPSDLSGGIVRFTMANTVTDAFAEGVAYYDMQVTVGGKRRTYLSGKFTTVAQITTG